LWVGTQRPAEVVVVDQSQGAVTERLVGHQQAEGLPVVYERQAGSGLGRAQNRAFALASCPVVAVLDDDCIAGGNWLATVDKTLAGDPTLAGVTGRVAPLPPDGERRYPVSSRLSEKRADFAGKGMPWLVGSGNNFALRAEWIRRIGGNDERLGPGTDAQGGVDMDLFYRLLRAGGRLRFEPASVVYHERQTRAGRLARRPMYGRGMGAACALWLRQGDRFGLVVLSRWLLFRGRLLARAAWREGWAGVHEEWLVIRGTVGGLGHGWRLGRHEGLGEDKKSPYLDKRSVTS
jgi:GT2 family glycosyltransferase